MKQLAVLAALVVLLIPVYWLAEASTDSTAPSGRSRPKVITTSRLKEVTQGSDVDKILEDAKNIAIVRVPDTPKHKKVQDYIISRFGPEWQVEKDTFIGQTPLGVKEFTNIIATLKADVEYVKQKNEEAKSSGKTISEKSAKLPKIVTLTAHYDSKYFKEPNNFVGATDSAVPCALMLDIANSLTEPLLATVGKRPVLKIIFFDGEEAFVEWTATDSVYGSRHLAEQWDSTPFYGNQTMLKSIELFILLDLIGASNGQFYSMIEETSYLFDRFINIAKRLREAKITSTAESIFKTTRYYSAKIEDDHIPWTRKGVTALHMISVPFPQVWHTERDDMNHISPEVVLDWSRVLRVFMLEFLHS